MPDKLIIIKEYEWLYKGGSNVKEVAGKKYLPEEEFEELKVHILSYKDRKQEDIHSSQIDTKSDNQLPLDVGNDRLQARNYVGTIQVNQDTQIQILPKIHLGKDNISKEADEMETRSIFIKMLKVYLGENYLQFDDASLDIEDMPLLEVFIFVFLNLVDKLIRRGLGRAYVPCEDNLYCLKGKIDFTNHLRYNLVHKERFYVKYDEFSIDRPVNRVIKKAIQCAQKIAKHSDNYRLVNRIIPHFDEVSDVKDWKHEHKISNVDRNIKDSYKNVLSWAELILNNLAPINWHGKQDTVSLLFPMEKIFEYYVTHELKKYINEEYSMYGNKINFSSQGSGNRKVMRQVKDDFTHKLVSFAIRPDMVVKIKDNSFILDTKWKILDQDNFDNGNKYGISQADIYQLYSYGKVYQRESPHNEDRISTELFLLYPRNEKFNRVITLSEDGTDNGNDNNLILKIIPVDLPDLEGAKEMIDIICDRHNLTKVKSAS